MEDVIKKYWEDLASINVKNEKDMLRMSLDPNDYKNIKNTYIDHFYKFYLKYYLDVKKEDNLFEIGCGYGRLMEFLAPYANTIYGTDLINRFIDIANSNPRKKDNTVYLKISELEKLSEIHVDKIYTVGVLLYFPTNDHVIETLKQYRAIFPNFKRAIFIEQVKKKEHICEENNEFYCCYRTIDDYKDIFKKSGLKVKKTHILGERYNGFFYRLMILLYWFLPKNMTSWAPKLFYWDKYFMRPNNKRSLKLIRNIYPTDVIFEIENNSETFAL